MFLLVVQDNKGNTEPAISAHSTLKAAKRFAQEEYGTDLILTILTKGEKGKIVQVCKHYPEHEGLNWK